MMRRDPRMTDAEDIYVYSEEDFSAILSDAFVEIREVRGVDDRQAAEAVDIVYERLTDDFYIRNK